MISKRTVAELERLLGRANVIVHADDLLVYEYDGTIDRGVPEAVVFPTTAEQVAGVVRIAVRAGLPIVPRGAGTGLSGGSLATEGGIVLVLTKMKRILELDLENRIAVVEPGLVNLELSKAVAKHGLYYAPDPSSQKACTIGGNIAENSGGPHCLLYGVTTNHVLGLELVLADGEIVRVGGWGRDRPGYDLTGITVGSEGTLAIATKICVRLLPEQESVCTLLAVFDSVDAATSSVSAVIRRGYVPAALEMIDKVCIQAVEPVLHCGYPLDAEAVLLIEVDGLNEFVNEAAAEIENLCLEFGAREVRQASTKAERERLWSGRKGAFGAFGALMPNYYILDGVVPRTRLLEVLEEVYAIAQRYGLMVANVFHAGDGNLHPNLLFDESIPGTTERVLEAGGEILRLCARVGGSITGEHGVGLEKREYMPLTFSPGDLAAMAKLKVAFGSAERLNPCKAFPAHKGCGEVHGGNFKAQPLTADFYV
ncbi:MAG: FAD-binding oxidoreductase [Dehalococcoidia bacterium]